MAFGIGTVTRMFGFDMGKTVNNVTSNLFGNSIAGRGLGAITGGLTAALTGDPIGVFQQAGNLFGSITQGLGSLFRPQSGALNAGRMPQLPMAGGVGMGGPMTAPMGGMGMGVPFAGGFGGGLGMGAGGNSGLGAAAGALNKMGSLRNQMNAIQNSN
ncbi:MAG: hypothetical protein EP343_34790, partial [Deltaproteobacteria bacterium]